MSARILVVDDSPTIRKVVGTILAARKFDPVLAADGFEALELLGQGAVDLVLLDFVMPRMNGYQFCRELRAHPDHKNLPVVLMSAKSDKVRGQFMQQTGAIDAITKPFDARALIAVVEGALSRKSGPRSRPVPDGESMSEETALGSRPRLRDESGLQGAHAMLQLTETFERLILPELERAESLQTDELRRALGRAATPEAASDLATLIRTLIAGDNAREVLAGDISVISIAEVLQMLDLQRQSGALSIFAAKSEIVLYLRRGSIDLATWRGLPDEFLLGRYLIEDGALSREDLNREVDKDSGTHRPLGERLVAAKVVTEEQVRKALTRQTAELVYEVVRWKTGRFSFLIGAETERSAAAGLGLEPSSLVMEGFRRVDEWRQIEGSFDFDEVLFPDPAALERLGSESKLTPRERAVLAAINGERTIRELLGEMQGSSFELCKILFQLLNSRLVRRKAAP